MNRRHFFAASLPVLLGAAGPRALAQGDVTPRPLPRRVKIEVSHIKRTLKSGTADTRTILVVADEAVETYAAFIQTLPYRAYQAKGDTYTTIAQTFGPSLRVTPHIQADGKIMLDVAVEYQEVGSGAAPDTAVPITSNSMNDRRTVESGHAIMLSESQMDDVQDQILLTATVLKPQERA